MKFYIYWTGSESGCGCCREYDDYELSALITTFTLKEMKDKFIEWIYGEYDRPNDLSEKFIRDFACENNESETPILFFNTSGIHYLPDFYTYSNAYEDDFNMDEEFKMEKIFDEKEIKYFDDMWAKREKEDEEREEKRKKKAEEAEKKKKKREAEKKKREKELKEYEKFHKLKDKWEGMAKPPDPNIKTPKEINEDAAEEMKKTQEMNENLRELDLLIKKARGQK